MPALEIDKQYVYFLCPCFSSNYYYYVLTSMLHVFLLALYLFLGCVFFFISHISYFFLYVLIAFITIIILYYNYILIYWEVFLFLFLFFTHELFLSLFLTKNTNQDAISYRAVGVPLGKIFTINPRGDITIMNWTYRKTYVNMNDLVGEMFPHTSSAKDEDEDFNNFNYWKMPLPTLDSPVIEINNKNKQNKPTAAAATTSSSSSSSAALSTSSTSLTSPPPQVRNSSPPKKI